MNFVVCRILHLIMVIKFLPSIGTISIINTKEGVREGTKYKLYTILEEEEEDNEYCVDIEKIGLIQPENRTNVVEGNGIKNKCFDIFVTILCYISIVLCFVTINLCFAILFYMMGVDTLGYSLGLSFIISSLITFFICIKK